MTKTSRLREICANVGFDLRSVAPSLLDRLELLANHTETVKDCERMASMAKTFFAHHEATRAAEAFSDLERRIVVIGCVLSDIGKTGPGNADASGQRLIAEMFAIEGVRDDMQAVTQFLKTYFPADAAERLRGFAALGLDAEMSVRAFWNLHSTWTLEIVESGGVPPEAVAGAATHHLLDDVNPGAIVAADHHFTRSFGANAGFDRAEKLIIVLDKYDALRRRGNLDHDQAIGWLHARVHRNPRFRDDPEFSSLIDDLASALQPAPAAP